MLNHLLKYNMWKNNNYFLTNPRFLLKFFDDSFGMVVLKNSLTNVLKSF